MGAHSKAHQREIVDLALSADRHRLSTEYPWITHVLFKWFVHGFSVDNAKAELEKARGSSKEEASRKIKGRKQQSVKPKIGSSAHCIVNDEIGLPGQT